jgi:RNA-directed DNA polymerase
VMVDGIRQATVEGTPQGSLCAAAHNPPYEQRWVMRSAWRLALVGAVAATGRCA